MSERIDFFSQKNEINKYKSIESNLIMGKHSQKAFFTIIIPTYKRVKLLKYALKSAVNQLDFNDYEILVLENGFCEESSLIEETIKTINNSKIVYYRNEKNIGLCGNWNRATQLACGKFIVMLHDDDLIHPYLLKTLYQFISNKRLHGCIGVENKIFYGDKEYKFSLQNVEETKIPFKKYNLKDIYYGFNINIAGMTYERDLLLKLGGFKENHYPIEDTSIIANMALEYPIIEIRVPLAAYRQLQNLSLSEGTMQDIVDYVAILKDQIAEKYILINLWNKIFREYQIEKYIDGAASFWGISIDKENVMKATGGSNSQLSFINKLIFNIGTKIYRGIFYLKNFKNMFCKI